jgi:hypothetical protein
VRDFIILDELKGLADVKHSVAIIVFDRTSVKHTACSKSFSGTKAVPYGWGKMKINLNLFLFFPFFRSLRREAKK